jgi:ribonuclease HII
MTALRQPDIPDAPDVSFESAVWQNGGEWVAGVDEAGRGALAGPVAAAAVILSPKTGVAAHLSGVRDSKQMSAAARLFWAERIKSTALAWAVGFAAPSEIDQVGILPATRLAAERALLQLNPAPDYVLLDYLFLPENLLPQTALIKGDQRSLSIAAASVLAKTTRDSLMQELDTQYPGYDLRLHKGYGTARHLQHLQQLGPSPIHRQSFAPCKKVWGIDPILSTSS